MNEIKERVLSGIRPTGFVHLGNYFGAIRNWVEMQQIFDCYFCVVDWHSLTTHPDTKELQSNVLRLMSELIGSGLDPANCVLYVQSDVPEIAELYLYLNMLAYKGELEKTATFKDKVRMQANNVNAGLLTYPVLQAADILIHRAVKVPVGKDQEQHVEMTRNFAERFNHRYGNVFPIPYAFNFGGDLLKIMSLDGGGKMSKSENHLNTIYLADDDDLIRKKIMKAKTDSGQTTGGAEKPGLFTLMKAVSKDETTQKFEQDFASGTIRYGDMKKQLADDLVSFISPIREKVHALRADEQYMKRVMAEGAAKARASAKATLDLVRDAIGIKYY